MNDEEKIWSDVEKILIDATSEHFSRGLQELGATVVNIVQAIHALGHGEYVEAKRSIEAVQTFVNDIKETISVIEKQQHKEDLCVSISEE